MFGIALSQVQDLALVLVELYKACTGLSLKPVTIPPDNILFLLHVNRTAQCWEWWL